MCKSKISWKPCPPLLPTNPTLWQSITCANKNLHWPLTWEISLWPKTLSWKDLVTSNKILQPSKFKVIWPRFNWWHSASSTSSLATNSLTLRLRNAVVLNRQRALFLHKIITRWRNLIRCRLQHFNRTMLHYKLLIKKIWSSMKIKMNQILIIVNKI